MLASTSHGATRAAVPLARLDPVHPVVPGHMPALKAEAP